MIRYKNFVIDIYDTGNHEGWCVVIQLNGKTVGNDISGTIESKKNAEGLAKKFCDWYVA